MAKYSIVWRWKSKAEFGYGKAGKRFAKAVWRTVL